MKQITAILSIFVGAFAAISPHAFAQSHTSMTQGQLHAALSGRTLVYQGGQTQTLASNGTTRSAGLSGSWRVSGSQLCSRWNGVPNESCMTVERAKDGSGYRLRSGDGRQWNVRVN